MERVVVVGAGLAGLRATQALRKEGYESELTLIGDEDHPPYNRPPLSKQVLAGTMEPDEVLFSTEDLELTLHLGQAATGLDREQRTVTLTGGEGVPYDGLVIATGRRARPWPDAPELEGIHLLRTLDDSLALRDVIAGGEDLRVVIVGAGFIGCEVAGTLRSRGVQDITLIDVAAHPMPGLGEDVGRCAARMHEEHGIRLRLGAKVASFAGQDRIEGVCLEDGERIDADLVLIAMGTLANTEWLEGSGLELHEGAVLCDTNCVAVGTDEIVAAGDVAAWSHPRADGPIWIEHWTNAAEMARAAAKNLLAGPEQREPYAPVPTFWSDQYDHKIKSVGFLAEATTVSCLEEDYDDWRLVFEGHRDDELVAAVVFNRNKSFIDYRRQLAAG